MKTCLLSIVLFLILSSWVYSQTATPPSLGDGSSGNPYQIATLENLYWISQNPTQWDKHYIQTADIDASAASGWYSGAGWDFEAETANGTNDYWDMDYTDAKNNGYPYLSREDGGDVSLPMELISFSACAEARGKDSRGRGRGCCFHAGHAG